MTSLKSQIQTLLLLAGRPLSVAEMAQLCETTVEAVDAVGAAWLAEDDQNDNGWCLVYHLQTYQLVSQPDNADLARRFLQSEVSGELSKPACETLAVIAYAGPVDKTAIEAVRGVNCGQILRNLAVRGLIEIHGQKYTLTVDCLRFLGLSRLNDLPEYEIWRQSAALAPILPAAAAIVPAETETTDQLYDV